MPGPLPLDCVTSIQKEGRLDLCLHMSIMGVPELRMGPGKGCLPRTQDP